MEQRTFLDWFKRSFLPKAVRQAGPKLLIFDGHSSHISVELVQEARANNVHLLCLPAHTTHLLQPLDVAVFSTVKREWREQLKGFFRTNM